PKAILAGIVILVVVVIVVIVVIVYVVWLILDYCWKKAAEFFQKIQEEKQTTQRPPKTYITPTTPGQGDPMAGQQPIVKDFTKPQGELFVGRDGRVYLRDPNGNVSPAP